MPIAPSDSITLTVSALDMAEILVGRPEPVWQMVEVPGGSMALAIKASSTEPIKVQVDKVLAGTLQDLSAKTVEMAFMQSGTAPSSGDWKAATWDIWTQPTRYFAMCRVGPAGTVTLAAGRYAVWVRVTDSPDLPVKEAGALVVV